jgi:hypothetical protein
MKINYLNNTGFPKSHFTEKRFNIFTKVPSKRADFFTDNGGMFPLQDDIETVRVTLC